jgi:uncharacterized DUF497 family protein
LTEVIYVFTFIAVKVTFDPQKRLKTLRERGIDFAVDAEKVFTGNHRTVRDDRFDYGEKRYSTIGWLGNRMAVVIWTPRPTGHHIISMRFCHGREIKKFSKRFGEI